MNLSRFDGHTPGDWHELMMQGNEYDNGYLDLQNLGFNEAAIDLIAAAPDLLAETKSLRRYANRLEKQLSVAYSKLGDRAWFIVKAFNEWEANQ